MNKILNWFLKPFRHDFSYLFILFLLIASIAVLDFVKKDLIRYAIYISFHSYITAYFLCLIGQNLPLKGYSFYKKILIIIASLVFIVDYFCQSMYGDLFNQYYMTIIMQSNFSELKEFMESYVLKKVSLCSFVIFIIFFIGIYNIVKLLSCHIRKKMQYAALIGVIIGIVLSIRNPLIYKDVFIGKIINILQFEIVPDLKDYLTYPTGDFYKKNRPSNIVMIIGESFSKSHSSLYGYNKITNPYLQTLVADSCLFVYQNIKSPATQTIDCFKAIMSTYKPEFKDSIQWYKCTTLPEILHCSGYYTYWISNQSKYGFFDTVVGKYADLCNQNFFVGNKFAGLKTRRMDLDEDLIPLLKPLLQKTRSNNFYFVHLMGSHSDFKSRYPQTFNRFKAEDYKNHPNHQRENLAAYDNSILYNDSIVYEILRLFQDQETIAFYFSDHAIDVYESSDDYIAHAKKTDPKSVEAGTKIPFMIYTSPIYQQNFPDEMQKIKRCIERPYRTDDIIYTIMDIIGIRFEGKLLEGESIFQIGAI